MSNRTKWVYFLSFVTFCLAVLFTTTYLNHRGLMESTAILENVVTNQLKSITLAAAQLIDAEDFKAYQTPADVETQSYGDQLQALRNLATNTEAQYIYALKRVGPNAYAFIYDTDDECVPFDRYEIDGDIFERAFSGELIAGISNLTDEWGSHSTGAAPIRYNNEVVGIVCADLDDSMLVNQKESTTRNFWLMRIILLIVMGATCVLVYSMLCRVKGMQDYLSRLANYDKLTNLPNRQYLMDTLAKMTQKKPQTPFALLFIDLDNFKQVNDNAGHDAGDELLKNIGSYLENASQKSTVYRVGVGKLNVTARIGGDEFILIVPGIATIDEAESMAKDLLAGFANENINRYIEKYHVGLSIGIALYPYHATDYNVLIKYADIAMYHAKHMGKNCYRAYEDELTEKPQK